MSGVGEEIRGAGIAECGQNGQRRRLGECTGKMSAGSPQGRSEFKGLSGGYHVASTEEGIYGPRRLKVGREKACA